MSFELLHFRGSEQILKSKEMENDVQRTLEYLDSVLYGSIHRRELLRQALDEMGWRQNRVLSVLDGRRYYYKGIKQRVAIEGSLALYEYILEGLLRLQIGFQKERIDLGILLLPAQRGEKTPYGSTRELVEEEVKDLYPTIDLPVAICLFELGKPGESMEGEDQPEAQSKETPPPREKVSEETRPAEQGAPEISVSEKQDSSDVKPSETVPSQKKTRSARKKKFKSLSAS